MLGHPEVSGRSCAECKQWCYQDSGERLSSKKVMRRGQPQPRAPGSVTPCHLCPKIPNGAAPVPANAVELSAKNWQCLEWYYQARAAGLSEVEKNDPICRRNMGWIDPIVRQHEIEAGTMKAVAALMMQMKAGG